MGGLDHQLLLQRAGLLRRLRRLGQWAQQISELVRGRAQSYGIRGAGWAPDDGFNYWPDWGPAVASSEGGQPTGPAAMFQVAPFPTCADGSTGPLCANGNLANTGHVGGIMVVLGDGSARLVNQTISPSTWWA